MRYLTIAIALLPISCDRHRGPEPADDQTADRQAEAKAAGAREAQEAVQRTRLDTLDSRVSRLEAEIADIEARRGGADDLKSALSQLDGQQAAVPTTQPAHGKPPKLKYEGVGPPPTAP